MKKMAKAKILLAEDDTTLRRLYREVFKRAGFEVVEAVDGQEAVDLALNHQPAMIILDLLMPRQGGLGALRVFRTLPECKDIPIIVLTALPNPEYKAEAAPWVQGYYLKTELTPAQLVKKVKVLLTPSNPPT